MARNAKIKYDDVYELKRTITLLQRYQNWRVGLLDEWNADNRVPPGEELSKVVNSALFYLREHKELICQDQEKLQEQSSILEVWSPSQLKPSRKRSTSSSSKRSLKRKTI